MNILLIGSGGREHALGWRISQSPKCRKLFIAPGNGGVENISERIDLDISNHDDVLTFCELTNINFVVIGPEAPLIEGLTDSLRNAGILTFSPSSAAAQLEGSKHFTKTLCDQMNVPTADYRYFTDAVSAKQYVAHTPIPLVIKADGPADGKGVTVAKTLKEAYIAIDSCFDGLFKKSKSKVIIEEFLTGEEVSMFFLCEGRDAIPFGTAKDYKHVGDGNTGPNTGGMGAYSPSPLANDAMVNQVLNSIILPSLQGLSDSGISFSGILFAGLIIGDDGPKLIEYNTRFGDPECQVLMMRLQSDLLTTLLDCAQGRLKEVTPIWSNKIALTVVMAASGYPSLYKKNSQIKGLENIDHDNVHVFHAGTEHINNQIQAIRGRVLNVTALGRTLLEAQKKAYDFVKKIDWPEGFYRRDIGFQGIQEKENN